MSSKLLFIKPRIGIFATGIWKILRRNFRFDRKNFLSVLLWLFVEPTVYLVALGYGLGSNITDIEGKSYIEFYFPGIVAMTVFMVSLSETTFGSFRRLQPSGPHSMTLMAGISFHQIIYGEIFWASAKAMAAVLFLLIVGLFLGLLGFSAFFSALAVSLLIAFLTSTFGLLLCLKVSKETSMSYFTTGLLVPLSLMGGVYFPVNQLPIVIRFLSWISPVTYSVQLLRSICYFEFNWVSGFYVFALCVLLTVTIKILNKKVLTWTSVI